MMFELPEAKRVRRKDLNNEGSSSRSDGGDGDIDPELQARLSAQIAKSLGIDVDDSAPITSNSHSTSRHAHGVEETPRKGKREDNYDDGLAEFDFRLFSTAGAPSKVILEDDTLPLGEGKFVYRRPSSHYLVQKVSESQRRDYSAAAVTGEDIIKRSLWPSWGMELPWKVTRTCIERKNGKPRERFKNEGVVTGDESGKKRKRLGKKTRIATRMKIQVKKEEADMEAKKMLDKEEHVKEKKKRLNRLKKLRKRAKKKAGKHEGDDESGESGSE